jgi:hypothetical protein
VVIETLAQVSVCFDTGMNAHHPGRAAKLQHKSVLHQWLAPTDRQSTRHQLQAMTIFVQTFNRALQSHRQPIHHVPGVRVVAVQTAPLASGSPGDDAHARPIDGRSGGKGMNETHFAGCQRVLDGRFRNALALIKTEVIGAVTFQR